ncbi:MAG: S-methyl-5-thioribose-1-phosphate isomerase [bacterium]|jgi:methylthioribose-1-phosphate isomerase
MVFDFWTIVLDFNNNNFKVLDQKLLPFKEVYIDLKNKDDVYKVIKEMNVRGAPLIGVVALVGVYLEVINNSVKNFDEILKLMDYLQNARPTAINVFNYFSELKDILKNKDHYDQIVKDFLISVILKEKEKNEKIAINGFNLIRNIFNNKKNLKILTHCNTGSLATIGLGTALGVIKYLKKYYEIFVWVDETRPYLQGSRLTALELEKEGIDFKIIPDSTAAYVMYNNEVDFVIVGADRVALNGDTANKIGTLNLAILASHFKIPFIVALPDSSIDKSLNSLENFKVELRDSKELLIFNYNDINLNITKDYYKALNPAFDVTPYNYIDYIITDRSIYNIKQKSFI